MRYKTTLELADPLHAKSLGEPPKVKVKDQDEMPTSGSDNQMYADAEGWMNFALKTASERDTLRQQVSELKDLLRRERELFIDPQPGLASWHEMKDRLHAQIDSRLKE